MAFKLNGSDPEVTKFYLWRAADYGNGCSLFYYVTADTPATVDGSGYIDNSTADGETAVGMLNFGDVIRVFQVSSITDTNTVQEDFKSGITDVSEHIVLENTGSVVDLSDDILGATVTYGD